VQDSNASVFAALLPRTASTRGGDDRAGRLRPDAAHQRRGRRLHGLPHERGHHGRDGGYETTNLAYAENGLPYVAESYAVTDQYLAEHKDLLKAFLIAEIKGWTTRSPSPSTTP
jgi:hypothetical protein